MQAEERKYKMNKKMKTILAALLVLLLPLLGCAETAGPKAGYTLDRVVVLSRHNIRSPFTNDDSLLADITSHTWFKWTSRSSELSLKGAILETELGQYFRQWLEDAGLFPENWQPDRAHWQPEPENWQKEPGHLRKAAIRCQPEPENYTPERIC